MANQEHVDRLLRGVKEWNTWRRDFPRVTPDLRGAPLRRADLSGADFNGGDLSGADLSKARLSNANLWGAHLREANLIMASLIMADLRGAHLRWADLGGANLSGADLREANLIGANLFLADLSKADLRSADLSEANLSKAYLYSTSIAFARVRSTTFSSLNLTQAEGLSSVTHDGPSPISTSTLAIGEGTIPASFLRGCGLSDWEIELAKLYQPRASHVEVNDILYQVAELKLDREVISIVPFISYSHADMEFADKLHDALQAKGVRVWRDVKDLLPGHKMSTRIDDAVKLADRVILVCSEASLTSNWVHKEIRKSKRQSKTDPLGTRKLTHPQQSFGFLQSHDR